MAGLTAARVLCTYFDRVSIVERDMLVGAGFATRKGLPQGSHVHGLSPAGYRVLEQSFPGVLAELVAAGAARCDMGADVASYRFGWKQRRRIDLFGLYTPRPTLDAAIIKHLRRLPQLSFVEGHDVAEPVHDPQRQRVTGVVLKCQQSGAVRTLHADLVVDATGRGSQSPKWLERWGYGEVPETNVRCEVGYASAYFERRPGDCQGVTCGLVGCVPPATRRLGGAIGVTPDHWLITLGGWLKDYPPGDLEGFRAFARSLPQPLVYDLIRDREPRSPISLFRFPSNRQRHFERLERFPAGYLVLGDALCSFNPAYGHGMSVALLESEALAACLSKGDRHLARRFFARAMDVIATPWNIATSEDLRFPEVEGDRPLGAALLRRYMDEVQRACTRDAVVMRRFMEVVGLVRHPASLLAPDIAARVALGTLEPVLLGRPVAERARHSSEAAP